MMNLSRIAALSAAALVSAASDEAFWPTSTSCKKSAAVASFAKNRTEMRSLKGCMVVVACCCLSL
jgi:hypothetical protein